MALLNPQTDVEHDVRIITESFSGVGATIAANSSREFAQYKIPNGYAGFIEYIAVQPDYNAVSTLSGADYLRVAKNGNEIDGITPSIMKGANMLRGVGNTVLRPMPLGDFYSDDPYRFTCLPVNEGETVGMIVHTNSNGVDTTDPVNDTALVVKYKIHIINVKYLQARFGVNYELNIGVRDWKNEIDLTQNKTISLGVENVTQLPGGESQDYPRIRHNIKFGRNDNAVAQNDEVDLETTNGLFNTSYDITDKRNLKVEKLGVYDASGNLTEFWLRIGQRDYPNQNRWKPEDVRFGDDTDNVGPLNLLREQVYRPLSIINETFDLMVKSTTGSITADALRIAFWTKMIEVS